MGTLALLVMGMTAIVPTFGGSAVLAWAPTVAVSTPTTITTSSTVVPVQQDHRGRWGLLRLLGLAGLAGLLKRPHT